MYKKADTIRAIRKLMEGGTRYTVSCRQIVKTPQTIENWRNKYPRVERYFTKLMDKREDRITDGIEDKLADRCLRGEASPAEIIFYLCNRRSHKWKRMDSPLVDQSQHHTLILQIGKADDQKIRTAREAVGSI